MVRLLLPTPKKCTFCFLASQLHCLLEIIPALVKKNLSSGFTKPRTRVPRYILIKSFFLVIGLRVSP